MKKIVLLLISTLVLTSCRTKEDINNKDIVVGASSTPHALILEQARNYIEQNSYKLHIKIMSDYVTPNLSLADGDLDANYFQHKPFMDDFNKNQGKEKLESAGFIHFEPMGIYQGSAKNGKILVPNDKSNYDRAMELLQKHEYEGEIVQLEAQTIPLMLKDCQYACINGNYALASNVIDKVIVTEENTSEIAIRNANIIACRNGDKNTEAIELLLRALTQKNIKDYIKKQFGSAVIPMF